jgi:hypothetical protein
MARRRTPKTRQPRAGSRPAEAIRVGDISGGTGFAIGPGAEAHVHQNDRPAPDEIGVALRALEQAVRALPAGPDRDVADGAVTALAAEARKGEQASESQVQKWLDFLARTAPDAWDVAIDTFSNPVKGIGTVFKKLAERARTGPNGQPPRD